jgi:myotubularin-related protein 1/2
VPNIHVMRESYVRLQSALGAQAYDWAGEGDEWLPALERSEWLAHIKLLLHGSLRVANSLHRDGHGVLVHCSDGWDRTSQLVCVAMLMLEPHYRTMTGYMLLIEKEWLVPGHKFHARCGHPTTTSTGAAASSKSVEEGRSPIFLQFLDCTHQLLAQFPCAFEFTDSFLIAIADALFSCRFGTFLYNSDKERLDRGAYRAPQLWPHLASRAAEFASPFYVPGEVLVPDVRAVSLRFWSNYFLRERRTQREGEDTQPEERGRQLKSTCEGLYRQVQEAEKELRRLRKGSATKRP